MGIEKMHFLRLCRKAIIKSWGFLVLLAFALVAILSGCRSTKPDDEPQPLYGVNSAIMKNKGK